MDVDQFVSLASSHGSQLTFVENRSARVKDVYVDGEPVKIVVRSRDRECLRLKGVYDSRHFSDNVSRATDICLLTCDKWNFYMDYIAPPLDATGRMNLRGAQLLQQRFVSDAIRNNPHIFSLSGSNPACGIAYVPMKCEFLTALDMHAFHRLQRCFETIVSAAPALTARADTWDALPTYTQAAEFTGPRVLFPFLLRHAKRSTMEPLFAIHTSENGTECAQAEYKNRSRGFHEFVPPMFDCMDAWNLELTPVVARATQSHREAGGCHHRIVLVVTRVTLAPLGTFGRFSLCHPRVDVAQELTIAKSEEFNGAESSLDEEDSGESFTCAVCMSIRHAERHSLLRECSASHVSEPVCVWCDTRLVTSNQACAVCRRR